MKHAPPQRTFKVLLTIIILLFVIEVGVVVAFRVRQYEKAKHPAMSAQELKAKLQLAACDKRALENLRQVPEELASLSVAQKIGQMLMAGFDGTNPDFILNAIRQYHIGGVIFYSGNIISTPETQRLIQRFQRESCRINHVRLLIATDEEGGHVERFQQIGTKPYSFSNEEWGAYYLDNPDTAFAGIDKQATETAHTFHQLGFNMNLAPVMDVLTNSANTVLAKKGRSYGANPQMVGKLGVRYIDALQSQYVIATAKHFPGHGSTIVDSHMDESVDNSPLSLIETSHLEPFREAISQGVEAIMIAHVTYPVYDDVPATLSSKIITGVLRNELGFQGVIISDSMGMGAIMKHNSVSCFRKAAAAGIDMLLVGRDPAMLPQAAKELKSSYADEELPDSQLDETVTRILRLKAKYCFPMDDIFTDQ